MEKNIAIVDKILGFGFFTGGSFLFNIWRMFGGLVGGFGKDFDKIFWGSGEMWVG